MVVGVRCERRRGKNFVLERTIIFVVSGFAIRIVMMGQGETYRPILVMVVRQNSCRRNQDCREQCKKDMYRLFDHQSTKNAIIFGTKSIAPIIAALIEAISTPAAARSLVRPIKILRSGQA